MTSLQGTNPVVPQHEAPAVAAKESSYGQILKSSALIGGSTAINLFLAIARTKFMALILGPAGMGLMALYSSITDLALSMAGMGVSSSGVRQIAESAATGNDTQVAVTASVLRRVSAMLGILGAVLLFVFARRIATFTFGSMDHTWAIQLLSLVVLFRCISGGQGALLQGMRRVGDLARMNVLGGAFALFASVPLVFFFKESGVAPALVAVAAMTMVASWWFSRQIQVNRVTLSWSKVFAEGSTLLSLGFAFMLSGLLTLGQAYVIRLIVLKHNGLDAAGLYQSSWALGGLYVGFILQAMGSDFYPRLTAVASDHEQCNRLVNEQALVGLLIGGPGALASLTFAPLVLHLFYSERFADAADPLRWICLGMILRVIAWPMGFIVLAKNAQKTFVLTEVAATFVHVGVAWLLVPRFGTNGAAFAFFGLYVWHAIFIYFIVRRLTGFAWSAENRRVLLWFVALVALILVVILLVASSVTVYGVGLVVSGMAAFFSLRSLFAMAPAGRLPKSLRYLSRFFIPAK